MDDPTEEVVQVIMQDDGQIVMPEGQFIQLDADNSEMQYIQVLIHGDKLLFMTRTESKLESW